MDPSQMVSTKTFLGKDYSINRPPSFIGECYYFRKLEYKCSLSHKVWKFRKLSKIVPSFLVQLLKVEQFKPKEALNEDGNKKIFYEKNVKNIIASARQILYGVKLPNCYKNMKKNLGNHTRRNERSKEI